VDVVSIAGERDFLAPVSSTILPGVRHVALPTGHSGLLVDARVADVIDEILRDSRGAEAGSLRRDPSRPDAG
jgi:gamma-glutamylcysteine synthetase